MLGGVEHLLTMADLKKKKKKKKKLRYLRSALI